MDGRSWKKRDLEEVAIWRKSRCGLEDHFLKIRRMTWPLVQPYGSLEESDGWLISCEEKVEDEGSIMKKMNFMTSK